MLLLLGIIAEVDADEIGDDLMFATRHEVEADIDGGREFAISGSDDVDAAEDGLELVEGNLEYFSSEAQGEEDISLGGQHLHDLSQLG